TDSSFFGAKQNAPTGNPVTHIRGESSSQSGRAAGTEYKPSTNPGPAVIKESSTSQKAAANSNSISSHSRPTAAATPTPKQDPHKDGKLNLILKKAGRILKKPF